MGVYIKLFRKYLDIGNCVINVVFGANVVVIASNSKFWGQIFAQWPPGLWRGMRLNFSSKLLHIFSMVQYMYHGVNSRMWSYSKHRIEVSG